MANFIDTLIDYPKSKDYAFETFDKLGSFGVLSTDMIEKYKLHVENLQKENISC